MTAHEPPQGPQLYPVTAWNEHISHEWDEILDRLDHIEHVLLSNAERIRELIEILKERT